MFQSDPSTLRHIPLTEYKKRRAYYHLWRKQMGQASQTDEHGIVREDYGFQPEKDAVIIGA